MAPCAKDGRKAACAGTPLGRIPMKQFHIFKHPTLNLYEAVKDGWSWPGFLAGGIWAFGIWAFVKRLWRAGTIILVVGAVSLNLPDAVAGLVMLAGSIAVGALGNEWRTRELRSRGFEPITVVAANTPNGALAVVASKTLNGVLPGFFVERPKPNPLVRPIAGMNKADPEAVIRYIRRSSPGGNYSRRGPGDDEPG